MMVLIFDGRKEGLVEAAKCITQTLFAILIFDQQNNGPGIWWKKGGVSWNSQLHNTDFVWNITAVPINNDIAMFTCDEIPKKKHLQMCSHSCAWQTVKCGKFTEETPGTPDVKSGPTRYRKGLWLQLMCCAPFRLLSQDFGTERSEIERSE